MNRNNYSIKNLLINLTRKQKIAILLLVVLMTVAIIIVIATIKVLDEDINNSEIAGDDTSAESATDASSEIDEGVQWGKDDEYVVDVPTNTEYNPEHEYTLIEYIPASRYEYKQYGDGQVGIRDYWWIMENTAVEKGIVVSVNNCNAEGNTAEANEFLKKLPVDLSEYTVVYQTHTDDMPCDI